MSHVIPEDDAASRGPGTQGRTPALVSWILYALTLPSGGLSAVFGVVIAYATRRRASGLVRGHIDSQIRLFWSGLIWAVIFSIAWGISALLLQVYVGVVLIFLVWATLLLLAIWFTVKGVLGAVALAGGREP